MSTCLDHVRRVLATWLVAALLAVLAGLAAPAALPGVTPSAAASDTTGAATGSIVGRAVTAQGAPVKKAHVALFDAHWTWLREVEATRGGRFAFEGLAPGTYQVQVTDPTPAWDISRLATQDRTMAVQAGRTTAAYLTLRRGTFITGTVTSGKRNLPARRARIVAADKYGVSHEVRANGKGQFALGGLPTGKLRLWAYDNAHRWVGKPVDVRLRSRGTGIDVRMPMRSRAGGLRGFIYVGGDLLQETAWVTAVHRRTGQWWVVPVRGGDLLLRGLVPGRYTIKIPAVAGRRTTTLRPTVRVKPGVSRVLTLRIP